MANMCINICSFSGGEANMKAFLEELKRITDECTCSTGVKIGDDVVFNLSQEADASFYFESKWSPALASLSYLCVKFGVSITCAYEELGSDEYGEWTCDSDGNVLSHISLTPQDIASVIEDDNGFSFNGKYSDCRYDFYNEMLECKRSK